MDTDLFAFSCACYGAGRMATSQGFEHFAQKQKIHITKVM